MKERYLSRGRYGDQENDSGTHRATHSSTHPATHPEKYRAHTGKRRKKTRRQRAIPYMSSSNHLEERTYQLLYSDDLRLLLTVYRLRDGVRVKPALLVCEPFPDIFMHLQSYHGGGKFNLMIRRGKIMMLSVAVSIAPLPR